MIFKTKGFVHTDQPENYVFDASFSLDREYLSLKFEFFGSGKELLFHVKDPSGLVRVQHQSSKEPTIVVLHHDGAKSGIGTIPGKIQTGKWAIRVFTYAPRMNRMHGKVAFEIRVYEGNERTESKLKNGNPWIDKNQFKKGQLVLNLFEDTQCRLTSEWLSGDFHVHSKLSDGSATNLQLIDEASQNELDFFFISEHNILTTGFPEDDRVDVYPSYEVTTAIGHFNAHGLLYIPEGFIADGPIPSCESLKRLIQNFRNNDVLISINHPFLEPWHWQYSDIPLSYIDSIEIITDPYYKWAGDANEKAINLLDILWNNGYRITGIGGSDTHTDFSESQLGQPITKVFGARRSLYSILNALKNQRVQIFIDCECDFKYLSNYKMLLPGTDIGTHDDFSLCFSISLKNESDPFYLCVVENGSVVQKIEIVTGEDYLIEWVLNSSSDWIRCELRDQQNRIRGYINPLHRGEKKKTIQNWGDAINLLI